MREKYHRLLSESSFIELLFEWDREEAERVRRAGCPHCGGVLDRSDYERKPRGIKAKLRGSQLRRISFCCRRCRQRTSPESIFYLRSKVYSFPAVFVTLSFWRGHPLANMRRACALCGASDVTLRRWRGWLERFLGSSQWKLLRARISAIFSERNFPCSLLDEFLRGVPALPEAIISSLSYLSLLSVGIF